MKRIATIFLLLSVLILPACNNAKTQATILSDPMPTLDDSGNVSYETEDISEAKSTPLPDQVQELKPEYTSTSYEKLQLDKYQEIFDNIVEDERFSLDDIVFSDLTLSYDGLNIDMPTSKKSILSKFGRPKSEQKEWVDMLKRESPTLIYKFATFVFDDDGDNATLIEVRIIGENSKLSGPRDLCIGDEIDEVLRSFGGMNALDAPNGHSEIYNEDKYYASHYRDKISDYHQIYFKYEIPNRDDNLCAELSLLAYDGYVENIVIGLVNSSSHK